MVPNSLRREILTVVHNAAHPGMTKTLELVKKLCYWKGMRSDVEDFCNECLICHRNKRKSSPKEELESSPIEEPSEPNDMVAFDIATLPWSSSQHSYFMIVIDLFSKFIELVPLKDQVASTICQGLLDGWIFKHGPPRIMLSDQGPNVDGTEVRDLLQNFGVEKRHSTPYHPEGDGQAERGVQTVKQVMRCMLEDRNLEKDAWPSILQETSYELNSMPNASTGYSPFRITYGTEPRQLATSKMLLQNKPSHVSVEDWYDEIGSRQTGTIRKVGENLQEARGRMKRFYNRGKTTTEVTKGDFVGLKKQPRPSGLDPCYLGPYQVIRRRGVDIEIQVEGRQRLVHLNRCKMFKRSGRVLSDTDTRERNNLSQVLPHRPASISSLNESSESNDDTHHPPIRR